MSSRLQFTLEESVLEEEEGDMNGRV